MKLFIIIFAIVGTILGVANSQTAIPYYGTQTNGVELSISLSNNIIISGATNQLQFQLKNNMTNFAYFQTAPEVLLEVSLINSAGEVVKLSRFRQGNPGGGPVRGLVPGEIKIYQKILPPSTSIKIGDYQLKAELDMYSAIKHPTGADSGERFFRPVSNILRVRVRDGVN